jgi:dynein regulatry complex protein 1
VSATRTDDKFSQLEYKSMDKRQRLMEKEYWERLAKVVPDDHIEVWKTLEKELGKYNSVLNERKSLLEETEKMRQQNAQLQSLIDQYVNSRDDSQMYNPTAKNILNF